MLAFFLSLSRTRLHPASQPVQVLLVRESFAVPRADKSRRGIVVQVRLLSRCSQWLYV